MRQHPGVLPANPAALLELPPGDPPRALVWTGERAAAWQHDDQARAACGEGDRLQGALDIKALQRSLADAERQAALCRKPGKAGVQTRSSSAKPPERHSCRQLAFSVSGGGTSYRNTLTLSLNTPVR